MELKGDKELAAPPEAVWAALIDPALVKTLIPGCETMEGSPEDGYRIMVLRQVGGVDLRMSGSFTLSEVEPGRGCLLTAEGGAGAAGRARGTARIRLLPEGTGTRLAWDIEASLEGRLAALPDFIASMAARKVADGFVERFAAAVEGREPVRRKSWLGRIVGSS